MKTEDQKRLENFNTFWSPQEQLERYVAVKIATSPRCQNCNDK